MKRGAGILVFALLLAGGCIDSSDRGYTQQPGGPYGCRQLDSCGTCTPVLGCGWCTIGSSGMCVADPDECARAQSFSWTWEPSGCPGVADGGAPETGWHDTDAGSAADAGAAD